MAFDVSKDGTVVGTAVNSNGDDRAFRWTRERGMQDLGTLGGPDSHAYGISDDGLYIVGVAYTTRTTRAFLWTESSGMQDLGTLPKGGPSEASAVCNSVIGPVVVGYAVDSTPVAHAFRWTTVEGMQDLGTLRGARYSYAYGVSADGSIVVGRSVEATGGLGYAFLWTASDGMKHLGLSPSQANSVSDNGSVVVGFAQYESIAPNAFRWTRERGMQNLGTLGGTSSWANDVTPDGAVVVGGSTDSTNQQSAFIWLEMFGMLDLNTIYAGLLRGSRLLEAHAISPDGRYIVGEGFNEATGRNEAFILDTWGDNVIQPNQAVRFQQVHFSFPNGAEVPYSSWGRVSVDRAALAESTGLNHGFLNVATELGWVVHNLPVDSTDEEVVTYFALSSEDGEKVDTIRASLSFTINPVIRWNAPWLNYPVDSVTWDAAGAGEGSVTYIGSPPPPNVVYVDTLDLASSTWGIRQLFDVNVQTALNQCFPMSIANSLDYLWRAFDLQVPHAHRPGLRGDTTSIVGWLDSLSNRYAISRDSGGGVWFQPMLRGKFAYLARSGLQNALTHKHQGRGYGDPTEGQALPDGDFTSNGITSYDSGAVVSWRWICEEIRRGEDVELVYSYDSANIPLGGHAVRVIGCGQTGGRPWIRYLHDRYQSDDSYGLEQPLEEVHDLDGDGIPNLGSHDREIRFVLSESIREPSGVGERSVRELELWIEPHPAGEGSRIRYRLEQPMHVEVLLFNLMGQQVARLAHGIAAAGEHTVALPPLPSGVYTVLVRTAQGTTAQRLVVTR